jgi:hypothetical protein
LASGIRRKRAGPDSVAPQAIATTDQVIVAADLTQTSNDLMLCGSGPRPLLSPTALASGPTSSGKEALMDVYVGMDVHHKHSQVAIIDEAGVQQRNRNVPNDPAKLGPSWARLRRARRWP